MMGLMVLGFFAVYLALSVWAVKAANGWAMANNKKPWLWGGLAAFVMYNLVFWDLIPTLLHKYYCSTQAGFWVYKTSEQWKAENLGQEQGLIEDPSLPSKSHGEKGRWIHIFPLNKRFNMVATSHQVYTLLPVYKYSEEVIDTKNNKVMNRLVGVSARYFDENSINSLKLWIARSDCGLEKFAALSVQAHSDFANIGKGISKRQVQLNYLIWPS